MSYPGYFISLESTKEGLGKTTQAPLLAEKLRSQGYKVITTREPGGTELGSNLRKYLLDGTRELSDATELFLLMADRSHHYTEVILPALEAGYIVICDRYFDSTLAYQGVGRGWSQKILDDLHEIATDSLYPDLTFVFHGVSFKVLSEYDRLERLGSDFHNKVERAMLSISKDSERYILIEANNSQEEVTNTLYRHVNRSIIRDNKVTTLTRY